ncbi:hypothetical protein BASA81_015186 [Batrachochytrium salamandrivorans]|nr:hypothetical protein BASA81_015186 [Batrachochytrium salamandrivorans]
MAFRKPVGEDPRFSQAAGKFRESIEKEFPRLRHLDKVGTVGLSPTSISAFTNALVSRYLGGNEDDVLVEMVLAVVLDKQQVDQFELMELLEPFIGKKDSFGLVGDLFQYLVELGKPQAAPVPTTAAVTRHVPSHHDHDQNGRVPPKPRQRSKDPVRFHQRSRDPVRFRQRSRDPARFRQRSRDPPERRYRARQRSKEPERRAEPSRHRPYNRDDNKRDN